MQEHITAEIQQIYWVLEKTVILSKWNVLQIDNSLASIVCTFYLSFKTKGLIK